ncbi:hypothetical protein BDQ17DRAFT_1192962, partial [Cyathus striatus]
QVLGVTCDNVLNNNAMVEKLNGMLNSFSSINHIHCFLHINNLVAQTFIWQFD